MIRPFAQLLLIVAMTMPSLALAQESNRYFVYFKNKGAATNTYALNDPAAFLTNRAIERRWNESIAIDSTDLPVNASYLASVQEAGGAVFFASKWLNGSLIEASDVVAEFC